MTFDLALRASDTGRVGDAFSGPRQFPLLSVGNWFLYDRGLQRPAKPRLFVAAFLSAVRERGHQTGLVDIARWSASRAALELDLPGSGLESAATSASSPRWSDGALSSVLAAAHLVGADDGAKSQLPQMITELATAFELLEDLESLPQDVLDGRTTAAVELAASAANQEAKADPYLLLGSMVAANALAQVARVADERLAAARSIAEDLALPTFVAFIDATRRSRERGVTDDAKPATLSNPVRPTVASATHMASAFLLSDLSFAESWETHREGMLGAELVSSRFPAALILEILSRNGHELQGAIDEFIIYTESNGFRYYDHPNADPDSDTVGAVLRLLPFSSRPHHRSAALTRMLDCIDEMASKRREFPVWLTACADAHPERPETLRLGEGCGTVVAHLLLGLASLGEERAATTRQEAAGLFDRIAQVGLGANVNYPPRYALLTYFRLLKTLQLEHPAADRLNDELERRCAEPIESAQEAALALLGAWAAGRPELIRESWTATILDQQRFDGSWLGEPFAVAPNRGRRATAYSSTTLSTALCYDALTLGD